MKFIKLFIIAIIIVVIFFSIYLQLYVGEYVRYGKLKNVHERICPLITNENWCKSLGCVARSIKMMPAPGKPWWFCRAKNIF